MRLYPIAAASEQRESMISAAGLGPVRPERRRVASVLDAATVRSLRLFSLAVGMATAAMGALVLVRGWGFDIASLKSGLSSLSTMKPNTALAIATLGAGLVLSGGGRSSRVVGVAMAGLALAIGLLTLAEDALGWNAGIDELLWRDMDASLAAHPGRPATATALMVTLLAIAQLSGRRPRFHVAKMAGALVAALIAWASLSGHVFGSQALHEVSSFSSVALLTAAAMLLLAIGTLAVEPVSWPLPTALAKSTSGTVCRWLLPPAILAPPLLGWLLSRVGTAESYPDAFRWALYSVASSLGSVALILLLAHRIALLDAERAFATEMSLRDPLTGLANRRAFDSFLFESFSLAKRYKHPLSLALLDIDHFKSYNDDYGHPTGDELLKSLAGLLISVARETDLVARIGGEEFAIVLPETDLAGARVIAERVRAEMERSVLFRRRVTLSIGVVAVTSETTDPSMLVRTGDEVLYRAKAAGRNNVSVRAESAGVRADA